MLLLKPGDETVNYITANLRLEVFESEDVEFIKNLERKLILQFQPKFNSTYNSIGA